MQNLILASLSVNLPLEEATNSLGGNAGPDLTQYFVVCAILIVVTAAVAFGMRKLISGSLKTKASQRALHVVDVLSLGGRRKLAVVRCYDRTFVLGMGEKEICPIAELDPVIGSDVVPTTPRHSDQEAFESALAKISESMPQQTLMNTLLEAQDAVSPSLAQKMAEARAPIAAPQEAPAAPIPMAAVEPHAAPPAAPAVVKKRVRRKVAKRTQAPSARHQEAQAVASAALDMAAAKRKAQATATATGPAPVVAKPTVNEQPPILRLEGILG
jgi:flagellar biogenesis protein FliO